MALIALAQMHIVACFINVPSQSCTRAMTVNLPRAAVVAVEQATAIADMEHMPMDTDYPGIRSAFA